jgi:hypothetical protein
MEAALAVAVSFATTVLCSMVGIKGISRVFTILIKILTGQIDFNLEGMPDQCPVCHRGVKPVDQRWDYLSQDGNIIERVFACPFFSCSHLFVGRYHKNSRSGWFFLKECVPTRTAGRHKTA